MVDSSRLIDARDSVLLIELKQVSVVFIVLLLGFYFLASPACVYSELFDLLIFSVHVLLRYFSEPYKFCGDSLREVFSSNIMVKLWSRMLHFLVTNLDYPLCIWLICSTHVISVTRLTCNLRLRFSNCLKTVDYLFVLVNWSSGCWPEYRPTRPGFHDHWEIPCVVDMAFRTNWQWIIITRHIVADFGQFLLLLKWFFDAILNTIYMTVNCTIRKYETTMFQHSLSAAVKMS